MFVGTSAQCPSPSGSSRIHGKNLSASRPCPTPPTWRTLGPVSSTRNRLRSLLQHAPVWLALLSLLLRMALPALHHHHEPTGHECACHHEPAASVPANPAGTAAAPGTVEATANDHPGCLHDGCLACELELSTPGTPVPVPVVLAEPQRKEALQLAAAPRPQLANRTEPQSARAPPAPTTLSLLAAVSG